MSPGTIDMLLTILTTILVLGSLVFVHELGHFLAARWAGVRVLRFSVGLGKPIVSKRIGNTEYALSWIPLGGYVSMAGMNMGSLEGANDATGVPREEWFSERPAYKRAVILAAGVTMNLVFAAFLYGIVAWKWGRMETLPVFVNEPAAEMVEYAALRPLAGGQVVEIDGRKVRDFVDLYAAVEARKAGDIRIRTASGSEAVIPFDGTDEARRYLLSSLFTPDWPPVVGFLERGGPAEQAGIRVGDRIVALNGREVRRWSDIGGILQSEPEDPVRITFVRDGETHVVVTATKILENGRRVLGVYGEIVRRPVGAVEAAVAGIEETARMLKLTVSFLFDLVSGRIERSEAVGGPILLADFTGEAARSGLRSVLQLTAFVSINLAVMNLLPIPILDGGLLLLLGIESVRGRPVSPRVRLRYLQVGVLLVICLMAWTIVSDLVRLVF